MDNSEDVYLTWEQSYDTNFKSYQIEASLDTLFNTPLIFDLSDYSQLQNMRLDNQIISGLNNTEQWLLRIRGVDHFNNVGPWSEKYLTFFLDIAPQIHYYTLIKNFLLKALQVKI